MRASNEGSRANMNSPLGFQVNPPGLANSVSLTRLTPDKQLNLGGEESLWVWPEEFDDTNQSSDSL